MKEHLTDEPWQSYTIFDAAEQWGFDAKTGRRHTLGEGVYVKRSVFNRYFVIQDGYTYSVYALKGHKKPLKIIEQALWPYELGVRIDHLLKK